jgi:SET domain-containing protein
MSIAAPKLTVARSRLHGRGVFTTSSVRSGEVLERCHLLLIPIEEVHDGSLLGAYVFEHSKRFYALALGSGSMYNHAPAPNAEVEMDSVGKTLTVSAVADIPAGVEVTIDYGPEYWL